MRDEISEDNFGGSRTKIVRYYSDQPAAVCGFALCAMPLFQNGRPEHAERCILQASPNFGGMTYGIDGLDTRGIPAHPSSLDFFHVRICAGTYLPDCPHMPVEELGVSVERIKPFGSENNRVCRIIQQGKPIHMREDYGVFMIVDPQLFGPLTNESLVLVQESGLVRDFIGIIENNRQTSSTRPIWSEFQGFYNWARQFRDTYTLLDIPSNSNLLISDHNLSSLLPAPRDDLTLPQLPQQEPSSSSSSNNDEEADNNVVVAEDDEDTTAESRRKAMRILGPGLYTYFTRHMERIRAEILLEDARRSRELATPNDDIATTLLADEHIHRRPGP